MLDDLSGGFRKNAPAEAEFVEGSVCDAALVRGLFNTHRFDYVYHLAAYAAEGLSHFIRRFNYENNVVGSINLVNESIRCGSVKRFVFTSSIAVYGAGQVPMVENQVPVPEDPYGVAKRTVELDLEAAQRMFGLEFTVFRPHNVYGERQCIQDPFRNVIGIFMNQVMQDEPMTVFGDGQQTRAFTYFSDVAPIIARSVELDKAKNEVFNLGSDQVATVLEVAKEVADAFEKDPMIRYLEPRKEVVHAFSSHEKVGKVFGEQQPVSLSGGIRKMAAWVRDVGPRGIPRLPSIEVSTNLPRSWREYLEGRAEEPSSDGDSSNGER